MSNDLTFQIGGDSTPLDRTLSKTANDAGKFAGNIARDVTGKLTGLKNVSNTVAAALGLNLQNIADGVARWFTGVSKAEEAAYQRSEQLSTQLADLAIKNMRARLEPEQLYQMALNERERLQRQVNEIEIKSGEDMVKMQEKQIELQKVEGQIIEFESRRKAEAEREHQAQLKDRAVIQMEQYKAELDRLSLAEQEKHLSADIAGQVRTIENLKTMGVDTSLLENQLQEKRKLLVAATKDAEAERLAVTKQIAGSAAEALEKLRLQDRVVRGIATEAERARLQQLILQEALRRKMAEIAEYDAKLLSGTLTPEEKARLLELQKQKEKLDEQIAAKIKLIEAAGNQKAAEEQVTEEIEKQKDASEKADAARRKWGGSGSPLGMTGLGNVSSDVLVAKAQQMERELRAIELMYQQRGYAGNARQDNYFLVSQIDSIRKELAFRQSFSEAVNRGGRERALQQYVAEGRDPLSFDTAFANMQSWSQGQDITNQKLDKTNATIERLSKQLANSGIK